MTDFKSKVLEIVRNIPRGSTLSYGEVARLAGNSTAARAVGRIMSRNFDPGIPCHRVVKSDGAIGGYNRGSAKKAELLHKEAEINN